MMHIHHLPIVTWIRNLKADGDRAIFPLEAFQVPWSCCIPWLLLPKSIFSNTSLVPNLAPIVTALPLPTTIKKYFYLVFNF